MLVYESSSLPTLDSEALEDDILLGAEWEQVFRTPLPVSGERGLALAILKDAIETWQRQAPLVAQKIRAQRICRELDQWFTSQDGAWLYSYRSLCSLFGLNATRIWRELQQPGFRLQPFRRDQSRYRKCKVEQPIRRKAA